MNIVQLYLKTLSYFDRTTTPRFDESIVVSAIETASRKIVNNIYEMHAKNGIISGFEASQAIKDKLRPLIKTTSEISVQKNSSGQILLKNTGLTDYMFTVAVKVKINNKWIYADDISHNERNDINKNPFRRPTTEYPENVYRVDYADGYEILSGEINKATHGIIEYLKYPQSLYFGIIMESGTISSNITIIAVDDTVITYGIGFTTAKSLRPGEEFKTTGSTNISSGKIVRNFINSDMPLILHESIAAEAAIILKGENRDLAGGKFVNENKPT